MATIEKRTTDNGTAYRVKVRMRGFPPESATFERLTDAKDWASKIERDMKEGRYFGQSKRHTFKELADEYEPHAKDKVRLEYWRGVFGSLLLADITPSRISKERDKLLNEETQNFATPPTGDAEADAKRPKAKRSGPTVNRYLAALSVCLSHGVKELRWLERNPCELIRKPAESRGRVRFLSDDERTKLLEACRPHADLYLAVILSLTTGARQGEVMSLRWGQIDFARQVITLHDTKNGERRSLPLVGEAFTLLQARSKVRNLKDVAHFPADRQSEESGVPRPPHVMGERTKGRRHQLTSIGTTSAIRQRLTSPCRAFRWWRLPRCWGTARSPWSRGIRTCPMVISWRPARSWRLGWEWRMTSCRLLMELLR